MKHLLKQLNKYLRRKLKELKPSFISITVMVPSDIQRDLVDEHGDAREIGGRPVVSFVEGNWPNETVMNITSEEE